MKRCSLFCADWWPFLLFPLLLLMLFSAYKWRNIEQDISANVKTSLSSTNWVSVETFNRGRDVLLIGTAPNTEAIFQAKQLTLQSEGVRVVEFIGDTHSGDSHSVKVTEIKLLDIEKPALTGSASLNIRWADGHIYLTGILDSQASIDAVVSEASTIYEIDRVVNQLNISNRASPISLLEGLFSLTSRLDDGDSLLIKGKEIILNGDVASSAIKNSIGDGIANKLSLKVKNLLIAAKVKNDQCQTLINEFLAGAKINFDSAKATIKIDSHTLLKQLANTAKRCPNAQFEVTGHTDSIGSLELNIDLSQLRAQAVIDHLSKLGVNVARLSAVGLGSKQSIANNDTPAGRAQNRRIEFNIKN